MAYCEVRTGVSNAPKKNGIGGDELNPYGYISSTQNGASYACTLDLSNGMIEHGFKTNYTSVRPITTLG